MWWFIFLQIVWTMILKKSIFTRLEFHFTVPYFIPVNPNHWDTHEETFKTPKRARRADGIEWMLFISRDYITNLIDHVVIQIVISLRLRSSSSWLYITNASVEFLGSIWIYLPKQVVKTSYDDETFCYIQNSWYRSMTDIMIFFSFDKSAVLAVTTMSLKSAAYQSQAILPSYSYLQLYRDAGRILILCQMTRSTSKSLILIFLKPINTRQDSVNVFF